MRTKLLAMVLGALGAAAASLSTCHGVAAGAPTPSARSSPVVVLELFSSEGCSSCPPADRYAAALDRDQPIEGVTVLVLEEHVDYWDRLGWRDPFAAPAFGARQSEYARVLPDHGVFTPEIVLDGHLLVPNGDEEAARRAMLRAASEPKVHVSIRRDVARVGVDVTGVPATLGSDVPELWLAVTESGLATDVPAGENAGRRLVHAPVVRELRRLGRLDGAAPHLDAVIDADLAGRARVHVAAFVQLATSRRILGAAGL